MVYIIQEELECEGGVGPIVAVDAHSDLEPMYSVVDAIAIAIDNNPCFASWSGPQEIDDEYADDEYWFIEKKSCTSIRLGIRLVDVL